MKRLLRDIQNKMFLVVDVNAIISSLISRGDVFSVFFFNYIDKKYEFIAPEFFLEELEKHMNKIKKNSNLPEEILKEDFDFIMDEITIIPKSQYEEKIKEAKEILKNHWKDFPYLALALKFDCHVLSGDKVFKQLCPERVKNPKEVLNELFK